MRTSRSFLGVLLGVLITVVAACGDDCPTCPKGGPDPGPGPGPGPGPSPADQIAFHSFAENFESVFITAPIGDEGETEITPPGMTQHGGLLAFDNATMTYASVEGTGDDLNLWQAAENGAGREQISTAGCDYFGNITDISVDAGVIAFTAEFRTNEVDAELGICIGTPGNFRKLNHGDAVNSRSLVLRDGWVYTALRMSNEREQIVRISVDGSREEAIGPARPENAEVQVQDLWGNDLVVVALALNVLSPSLNPDAFLVNTTSGAARELTQSGNVEDAFVCGNMVGLTFRGSDPFLPDTRIVYVNDDGSQLLEDSFSYPVIDPTCVE